MTALREAGPPDLPGGVRELLAANGLGDEPVRFAVASPTRIDTGGWLRGEPLVAAVAGERFVLAAAGPRPFVRVLPLAALSRAVYNHVTGELAFPSVTSGPPLPAFRIDALQARALLGLIAPQSSPGVPARA